MKVIIGFIALIFVALAVYTYTDKKDVLVSKSAVTHKVEKVEVTEPKVSEPVVMKAENTPSKPVAKKSTEKELVSKGTSANEVQVIDSENKIGKGITQDDIDNAENDEEKQRLIDERAYAQSLVESDIPLPTEDEILKIIEEDLKNENR